MPASSLHGSMSGYRIHIDGAWTVEEMAAELSALDYLYTAACLVAAPSLNDDPSPEGRVPAQRTETAIQFLKKETRDPALADVMREPLRLQRVQFASPGIQEIVGYAFALGLVIGQLRKGLAFLNEANTVWHAALGRRQQRKEREFIHDAKVYDWLRRNGASQHDLRMVRKRITEKTFRLSDLARNGKIKAVEDL